MSAIQLKQFNSLNRGKEGIVVRAGQLEQRNFIKCGKTGRMVILQQFIPNSITSSSTPSSQMRHISRIVPFRSKLILYYAFNFPIYMMWIDVR